MGAARRGRRKGRETGRRGKAGEGRPARRCGGKAAREGGAGGGGRVHTWAPWGAGCVARPGGRVGLVGGDVVLSRGKVTPSTVGYYTSEVARGFEDYYAGHGEALGVWLGAGTAKELLTGAVSAEELARLFRGEHPATGEPLGAAYAVRAGADRVTGWDLTFSAPKSVSVVWAVGGGDIGLEVRDAHDAAVRAALAYLEEHAAFSRTGKAGVRQVDTEGLVAAGFVHRQSRAGDPQLHTHVLVSGRVRCRDDGIWRALDSRALHRQLKPAGMLYQAALRAELTNRLGVAWTDVDVHGQAEVAGVPDGLRRRFSQRRAVAETRVAELVDARQRDLGRALTVTERRMVFQQAVLETRQAKHQLDGDVGLHDRWRGEAIDAGFAPDLWLGDSLNHSLEHSPPQVNAIVAELETGSSTWRRAEVVRAVTRHTPATIGDAQGARAWVELTVDAVLNQPGVIRLTAPDVAVPGELCRRDGGSVFERHDTPRFSTLATLQLEQHVLDTVDQGRGVGRAVADRDAVATAIAYERLGGDQAAAVEALTMSGDAVSCVVGPAGAGKSRTMRAAAHAWITSGIPVRGLAVSAVAAGVLATEARVPTDTIAKFLHDHHYLQHGEVVIVDEAGMTATRQLAQLLNAVRAVDGKLVLVGDPAQLGPVEAGGLFRLLTDRDAIELHAVRRFTHDWEADASLRLRRRDPGVLDVYQEHDRVVETDEPGVLDSAAHHWHMARNAGESLVITASSNTTVAAICDRIRDQRVAAGEVEPDGMVCDGQTIGVGDQVVTLRNHRQLVTTTGGWVRNGDRWTVLDRHHDDTLTVSSLTGRGTIDLPSSYTAEHLHLAYALTIHKAQGVTVDQGLVVVDDTTTAEALYVGMTRGRHTNTALVSVDTLDLDHHDPPSTARDLLHAALARPGSEVAATTALRQALAGNDTLAVLAPRLASLQAQITRDIPADAQPDLDALNQRRAYLDQQLRPGSLTSRGRDDRRLLRDLDDQHEQLQARSQARQHWITEHRELFDYRDQLAAQIVERRHTLGAVAAATQPGHLVDRLGPLPDGQQEQERWITRAARIEAYREEWGIDPDHLNDPPADDLQRQQWRSAIHTIDIERQLEQRLHDLALGVDADRGFGLEL